MVLGYEFLIPSMPVPRPTREITSDQRVLAQFVNETGEPLGAPLDLPRNINPKQLELLCNKLLSNVRFLLVSLFVHISSHACARIL